MRRIFAGGLCAVLVLQVLRASATAQFLSQREVEGMPAAPADHRVQYGKDALQFGDLRLPKGKGPHPVAIVIHGGCWLARYADLKLTAPLADALTRAGVATWNVEFRRVDNPGGGWPGTLADIGQAVDHVRELAASHPIDSKRVIVIGNSAGGHLALWAAARHRLPPTSPLFSKDPLPLRGALNLGGMGDLKAYLKEPCGGPIVKLVGGSPSEVPERYREASPAELLPLGIKQVLVAGAHDTIVRPEYAKDYAAAARKSGDDVEVLVIDGIAHFEVIAPGSSAWPKVEGAALGLLGLVPASRQPQPSRELDRKGREMVRPIVDARPPRRAARPPLRQRFLHEAAHGRRIRTGISGLHHSRAR